jgi:hypothetical protein
LQEYIKALVIDDHKAFIFFQMLALRVIAAEMNAITMCTFSNGASSSPNSPVRDGCWWHNPSANPASSVRDGMLLPAGFQHEQLRLIPYMPSLRDFLIGYYLSYPTLCVMGEELCYCLV